MGNCSQFPTILLKGADLATRLSLSLSLSVSLSSPHSVTLSFSTFFPLIIFVHITEEKAE